MTDNKNLIIAMILSTAILFLWQAYYVAPRVDQVQKQQQLAVKHAQERAVEIQEQSSKKLTVQEALDQGGRIKINTQNLHGSIALKGARLDDLTLAKYTLTQDKDSPEVILLAPSGTKEAYFAEFGWIAAHSNIKVPTKNTIWRSEDKLLSKDKPVTLYWDNGQGLKFSLIISVDENYMFTVDRKVENYGNSEIILLPYGLLSRTTSSEKMPFAILHEGALGVFDGVLTENSWGDLKETKQYEYIRSTGWLGFTDKYWLTALIPGVDDTVDSKFSYSYKNGQDRFQADYIGQKQEIMPGKEIKITTHLFAGAKEVDLLDSYSSNLGIPLFDRAVDFGILYFMTKPLFGLLKIFHNMVGNFGIAILLLTVVVKMIMFPLANKSYVSMHHLKRMQPQVMAIHKRYPDDKLKANKEIMELYKGEKVNPMSGCMPMIIQIPVFFALYKVLFVALEMRHAPFFGWINDLSAPDPTTMFNLFGLIDWTPPSILHIGAWPLIMAITMYMQQQMNPAPADPVQAKVMKFLPVIFVFMFASFPAGLVIYWAWNNILSIAQQWVITRRLSKSQEVISRPA